MVEFAFGFIVSAIFFRFAFGAAYRNGIKNGYGYSREPNCPGYKAAGKYLRETMALRWPELTDNIDVARVKPPQGGTVAVRPSPHPFRLDLDADGEHL